MPYINQSPNILTCYKPASKAEVWSIAYPLMLTALSANFMLFMDRLLLSRYMPAVMTAVTTIGMVFAIFQFGAITIASIAEVFVGKYYGANENQKIGPLVWQMIWFSIYSAIIFIPIGLFCGKYLIPFEYHEHGLPYFKTIMLFGPIFPLVAALSSFFIGQGKVKLVAITSVVANILNICFSYLFIFGLGNLISPLGSLGAALAGGLAISIQAILLFLFFLRKGNRKQFGTTKYHFIFSEFWRCIKLSVPNAVGHLIDMSAWAYLLNMMVHVGDAHIIAASIGQTLFLLVIFTADGLQKAIIAISANMIGSRHWDLIPTLIKSSINLHCLMVLFFAVPLLLFPENLVSIFFGDDTGYSFENLVTYARSICLWILIYFAFDGLAWIFAGLLISFEDIVFVMLINTINIWLFAILPNYIAVRYFDSNPDMIWQLMSIYTLFNAMGFALRYRKIFSLHKNINVPLNCTKK